jgi:hypothetical protein
MLRSSPYLNDLPVLRQVVYDEVRPQPALFPRSRLPLRRRIRSLGSVEEEYSECAYGDRNQDKDEHDHLCF